jgi:hypothetical protein
MNVAHTFTDTNTNFVASYGNAEANIINNGNEAVAMAKGSKGSQAGAWCDGREARIHMKGSGKAGVDGGMAWAMVGEVNVAISYCGAAQARAQGLPAPKGSYQMLTNSGQSGCGCSGCDSSSCSCPCHAIIEKLRLQF